MANTDLSTRLARVYQSFVSGDPLPMSEFLADEVVYHLPGRHLGGGTLRGRAAVFEHIAKAAALCDVAPRITVLHVLAAESLAVSLEHLTARRGERLLDQTVCVVWRMADERCVEVWSHFSDQAACDQFWEGAFL